MNERRDEELAVTRLRHLVEKLESQLDDHEDGHPQRVELLVRSLEARVSRVEQAVGARTPR